MSIREKFFVMSIKLLSLIFAYGMPIQPKAMATEEKRIILCARFGDGAKVIFEPWESNFGDGVADSIFGVKPISRKDAKPPTGYRCAKESSKDHKCSKGLHFESTRDRQKCVSKMRDLKELCGTEHLDNWPDLKLEICRTK